VLHQNFVLDAAAPPAPSASAAIIVPVGAPFLVALLIGHAAAPSAGVFANPELAMLLRFMAASREAG
jgi:hypothetical protein